MKNEPPSARTLATLVPLSEAAVAAAAASVDECSQSDIVAILYFRGPSGATSSRRLNLACVSRRRDAAAAGSVGGAVMTHLEESGTNKRHTVGSALPRALAGAVIRQS